MEENNKKKSNGTLIVSIIELIIIIGLVVFMVYFNYNSKTNKTTTNEKTTKVETKDDNKRNDNQFKKIDEAAEVKAEEGVNYFKFDNYNNLPSWWGKDHEINFHGQKITLKYVKATEPGNYPDWYDIYFGNNKMIDGFNDGQFNIVYVQKNYVILAKNATVGPNYYKMFDKNLEIADMQKEEKRYQIIDSKLINNKIFMYTECAKSNGQNVVIENIIDFENDKFEDYHGNAVTGANCYLQEK